MPQGEVMPFETMPKNLSPAAMAELDADIARRQTDEAQYIQDKADATAFGQKCRYEWEQEKRADKAEHAATEILELIVAPGVGAMAAWRTKSGIPIGQVINGVVGAGAKAVSAWNPENRVLRVAGRAGKTILHCQMSIIAYEFLKEDS